MGWRTHEICRFKIEHPPLLPHPPKNHRLQYCSKPVMFFCSDIRMFEHIQMKFEVLNYLLCKRGIDIFYQIEYVC